MEDVKRNKLQLNPVALSDPAAVRGIREDSAGYLIPDNAGSRYVSPTLLMAYYCKGVKLYYFLFHTVQT